MHGNLPERYLRLHCAKCRVSAPVPEAPVVWVSAVEREQLGGDFGFCRRRQRRQGGDEGGDGVGAEGQDVVGVELRHPGGVGADYHGVGV